MPDPDSPLYTLANLSVDLLNDAAHENISTPIRNVNLDSQVPDSKPKVSTEEEKPFRDCNQSPELCQPKHPTIE